MVAPVERAVARVVLGPRGTQRSVFARPSAPEVPELPPVSVAGAASARVQAEVGRVRGDPGDAFEGEALCRSRQSPRVLDPR